MNTAHNYVSGLSALPPHSDGSTEENMLVSSTPGPNDQHSSHRRKVRKGTRSCWECRGRKVKCTTNTLLTSGVNLNAAASCDGCILRGTRCVRQELPEHPPAKVDRKVRTRNRMVRVEQQRLGRNSLVKPSGSRLEAPGSLNISPVELRPENNIGNSPACIQTRPPFVAPSQQPLPDDLDRIELGPPPPLAMKHTPPRNLPVLSAVTGDVLELQPSLDPKHQRMSVELLNIFPTQKIVDGVVELAGLVPPFFHQVAPRSCSAVESFQFTNKEKQRLMAELVVRHTPTTHPLVILRQMLLLAIAFRYIHPSASQAQASSFAALLDERPGDAMQRIGDAALGVLEKSDSMPLETPEGLECLLLASTLHADSGNLRSAWSTTRRAMLLAQLMSLQRHHETSPVKKASLQLGTSSSCQDTSLLWHRIVFFDRFFSLALGLPQGSTTASEDSMAVVVTDFSCSKTESPLWYLQRRHCVLAGRILQRNERNAVAGLSRSTVDETAAIDHELQMAAQSMPSRWWLVPNLASIRDESELYQATMRLTEQVFHNILFIQLHLPFMLQSILGSSHHRQWGLNSGVVDLEPSSREACTNASRDFLHRYMALRNFSSVSYCCHSMDFFAVTASVVLVLAYLSDHRRRATGGGPGKALLHVHQRESDRAVMEEILDNMAQTGTLNKASALSERGAGILGRLLAIESSGWQYVQNGAEQSQQPSGERAVHLIIPCLGIITVTDTGEIIRRADDGCSAVTGSPHDVSTVDTATRTTTVYDDTQQTERGDHIHAAAVKSHNLEWNPNHLSVHLPPLSSSHSMDDNGEVDWLVGDAHMAFLESLADTDHGGLDSVDTNSWWLL